MPRKSEDQLADALAAFSRNAKTLMAVRGIESAAQLWRAVNKRVAAGPARKTVNNALEGRHDAQLSTLEGIAEALDCPLWVLMIKDIKDSDLHSPYRERLIAVVKNYLECDDTNRGHVENLAAAFAAKNKK